ncbi:MAG: hypothetical protein LBG65_03455 [Puniceicoccales bacterium]|jgi:hypothetical protein|nr:hypothetical protein [Puniceicoccales bacterium]
MTTLIPPPPATAPLTYDADGNMLTDGTGKTYVWDCENRWIQVTLPNNELVKYHYDAGSRRVKREHIVTTSSENLSETTTETITYLYDGWNVISETNGSATAPIITKSYIWGLDLSNSHQGAGGVGGLLATIDRVAGAPQLYFHAYDANGNTMALFSHYFSDTGEGYDMNGNNIYMNIYTWK